jgi:hypothetical protein
MNSPLPSGAHQYMDVKRSRRCAADVRNASMLSSIESNLAITACGTVVEGIAAVS